MEIRESESILVGRSMCVFSFLSVYLFIYIYIYVYNSCYVSVPPYLSNIKPQ